MAVLRDDKMRGFKVDIETDSTIKPQADAEQKNRIEAITAITGFFEKTLPAVQTGAVPKKVVMELAMFGIRAFPVGSQMEELLDEWAAGSMEEQAQGQQQDPAKQAQEQEIMKQAQHAESMRKIESETATANMVKAKAQAYGELVKAENLEPGMQLDIQKKRAALAIAMDPAAQEVGAPQGATVQ